jgi:DnaJ like chaperone protein
MESIMATLWPAEKRERRDTSLNIFGMLLGGAAGLITGGPIAGAAGAIVGHLFDRYRASERRSKRRKRDWSGSSKEKTGAKPIFDDPTETRRIAFATAIIVLSAKLAKADGKVSRDEINAFKKRFMISDHEVGGIARIYDQAKQSAEGFEPYARQIAALFGKDPVLLEELLIGLFEVASADGKLKPGEMEFLGEVAKIFGFDKAKFDQIAATFRATRELEKSSLASPYQVLGVSRGSSDNEIKTAYRKLVRELHPDQLVAKGLPKEYISKANDRLAAVNAAYDQIAKQRAIK